MSYTALSNVGDGEASILTTDTPLQVQRRSSGATSPLTTSKALISKSSWPVLLRRLSSSEEKFGFDKVGCTLRRTVRTTGRRSAASLLQMKWRGAFDNLQSLTPSIAHRGLYKAQLPREIGKLRWRTNFPVSDLETYIRDAIMCLAWHHV